MNPYTLYAVLMAFFVIVFASLALRGLIASRQRRSLAVRAYRYSRPQRLVTYWVSIPLIAFVAVLPYGFMPFTGMLDAIISLALIVGCGAMLIEVKNRVIITSSEGISSYSWNYSSPPLSWSEVRRVTFHNTFGGFFIVRHSGGRLYIPVQVERPLELIRDLEVNVPPAALASAKQGIQICRAHLG